MKPDPLQRVPRILLHKAQDPDYVQVYDTARKRHSIYLGKHGTAEAARRYREVLADILAGKEIATVKRPEQHSDWPTVAQLVLAFLQHAEKQPPPLPPNSTVRPRCASNASAWKPSMGKASTALHLTIRVGQTA